jgi:hypothetical protein
MDRDACSARIGWSLDYLVCLVCLVEPDKPDQPFPVSPVPPVLRGYTLRELGNNDRRYFGTVGMICRLHPCQTSRALLNPDIAGRQSKGIDLQRLRLFPS